MCELGLTPLQTLHSSLHGTVGTVEPFTTNRELPQAYGRFRDLGRHIEIEAYYHVVQRRGNS